MIRRDDKSNTWYLSHARMWYRLYRKSRDFWNGDCLSFTSKFATSARPCVDLEGFAPANAFAPRLDAWLDAARSIAFPREFASRVAAIKPSRVPPGKTGCRRDEFRIHSGKTGGCTLSDRPRKLSRRFLFYFFGVSAAFVIRYRS